MADNGTNGNGSTWRFWTGALFTVFLLGLGGIVGHLQATSVPRSELDILVKQADRQHATFAQVDADHEARIRLLEQAVLELTTIRKLLEAQANGKR